MLGARVLLLLANSMSLRAAEDPFSGVWELNLSKSKLSPPFPKSQTARVGPGRRTGPENKSPGRRPGPTCGTLHLFRNFGFC